MVEPVDGETPAAEEVAASKETMPTGVARTIGWVLVAHFIAEIVLLIGFWPIQNGNGWEDGFTLLGKCPGTACTIGDDARLFVIVLLAGGLGGAALALRSFADRVGERNIHKSYVWWYALRPFEGAAMALIFYLVLRGGLLSTGAATETVSVYGTTAMAVLVGMFSKQALAKLREVAVTVFKEARPATRPPNPLPVLEGLVPPSVPAGAGEQTVVVKGANFLATSTVFVDGVPRAPVFRSAGLLEVALTANDLATAGSRTITVFNPLPGGGMTDDVDLTVSAGGGANAGGGAPPVPAAGGSS